jgi:hypothetical protein
MDFICALDIDTIDTIDSLDDFDGMDNLTEANQENVEATFDAFIQNQKEIV